MKVICFRTSRGLGKLEQIADDQRRVCEQLLFRGIWRRSDAGELNRENPRNAQMAADRNW